MASVTRLDAGGRQGFRIRFYVDKRRREIYIPGSGRKVEAMAKTMAGHCEALAKAKANNVSADAAAIAWANGTDGSLRDNLVEWGLADPASPKLSTDEGRLLGPFLTAYINGRSDVKAVTRTNYRQTRRLLVEYFGERRSLRAITPGDASRWRRWMMSRVVKSATDDAPAETMAVASVSKHTKRAKTMLAAGVDDRLLIVSPFASLKGGDESNADRHRFIDAEMTAKVLAACPDADWRLIVTLARYGGLRCPSEVLALRWVDIDRVAGRMRIESSKTGVRFCPIFPEIKLALDDSDYVAEEGAVYCVARYRGGLANLRTQFARIVERAGVAAWPKMFVNLRSTRRTELQEKFPDHVINNWLGHSGAVAAKHYLQVTDEHWSRATDAESSSVIEGAAETREKLNSRSPVIADDGQKTREKLNSRSPTGSPIVGNRHPSVKGPETKKPRENPGFDGLRWAQTGSPMTPTGCEQSQETLGKTGLNDSVPPLVPPSQAIDDFGAEELLTIWSRLDAAGREDLMAVARGLAGASMRSWPKDTISK